jgi:anti-sigma B factor antagonist
VTCSYLEIETDGSDGVVRIHVSGELDMRTAPQLNDALVPLRASGRPLLIDLSELRFLDRAGLVVLADAADAPGDRAVLAVTGCRANVRRVFELTGYEELMNVARLGASAERVAADAPPPPSDRDELRRSGTP